MTDAPQKQTEAAPLLGLDSEFPDRVYVLKHSTGKYGCYCHNGLHGLACFSTEVGAFRFSEWIALSGMACEDVTFDEAREIAQRRPAPIECLMLLDDLESPEIHYVR